MISVSKIFVGCLVAALALPIALEADGTATPSHLGDLDVRASGGTGGVAGTAGSGATGGTGVGGTGATSGTGGMGGTGVGGTRGAG